MQLICSIATFTNPKTENCTRLYTPKQQTEIHTSTASHQKEALRIAKHYVSEEYVPKKKNTPERQTS